MVLSPRFLELFDASFCMETPELQVYRHYQQIIPESIKANRFIQPKKVSLFEIMDDYDAFCFDGYGTLYNRGNFIYDGALEWYKALRSAGKQMRLVTNAASNTDSVLAEEAAQRGFDFKAEEVFSSGSLLCELNHNLNIDQVYYIGRPTGERVLEKAGIRAVESPTNPVVAVSSNVATPEIFDYASRILQEPNSILLVLNPDVCAPKTDGTKENVSGTLSENLRFRSMEKSGKGCKTYYVGKPFPRLMEKVRASFKENTRVLMVGDTLGTDVYGAKLVGFDAALVVGRNVPFNEVKLHQKVLGVKPDYYL